MARSEAGGLGDGGALAAHLTLRVSPFLPLEQPFDPFGRLTAARRLSLIAWEMMDAVVDWVDPKALNYQSGVGI